MGVAAWGPCWCGSDLLLTPPAPACIVPASSGGMRSPHARHHAYWLVEVTC